jgi:hypothetical protein
MKNIQYLRFFKKVQVVARECFEIYVRVLYLEPLKLRTYHGKIRISRYGKFLSFLLQWLSLSELITFDRGNQFYQTLLIWGQESELSNLIVIINAEKHQTRKKIKTVKNCQGWPKSFSDCTGLSENIIFECLTRFDPLFLPMTLPDRNLNVLVMDYGSIMPRTEVEQKRLRDMSFDLSVRCWCGDWHQLLPDLGFSWLYTDPCVIRLEYSVHTWNEPEITLNT